MEISEVLPLLVRIQVNRQDSIEKIPTWAFGYIFNGDMTSLTDEEV